MWTCTTVISKSDCWWWYVAAQEVFIPCADGQGEAQVMAFVACGWFILSLPYLCITTIVLNLVV